MIDILEVLKFLKNKLISILKSKFTGKITFTLHCKDGGIGKVSIFTEENFCRKDLTFNSD